MSRSAGRGMSRRTARALASVLLAAVGLACGETGGIAVHDPWVMPPPAGTGAAGGFLVIENPTGQARELVGATSPACERITLHRSVVEGGVARMEVLSAIPVPAGGRAELAPGGYHLMLMEPRALEAGETVPLTLELDDGSRLRVEAEVRPAGGPPHGAHDHEATAEPSAAIRFASRPWTSRSTVWR